MDVKVVLALTGTAISFIAPLAYIRNVLQHKTKPHIVSWMVWTILAAAASILQFKGGGGVGSLVLASTALVNAFILFLCVIRPKDHVTHFDIFILIISLVTIVFWLLSDKPELSITLVTLATFFGAIPTYRNA